MPGKIIPFPKLTACPHCFERIRTVAFNRHLDECQVLSAKRSHPSNPKPDGGGVA